MEMMKKFWLVLLLVFFFGLVGCGGLSEYFEIVVPLPITSNQGGSGQDGADGLNCWDLNGNGDCDGEEDWTGEADEPDGVCDALDCRGAHGIPGPPGDEGPQGPPGPPGAAGGGEDDDDDAAGLEANKARGVLYSPNKDSLGIESRRTDRGAEFRLRQAFR